MRMVIMLMRYNIDTVQLWLESSQLRRCGGWFVDLLFERRNSIPLLLGGVGRYGEADRSRL
jgi:hypothetical protein